MRQDSLSVCYGLWTCFTALRAAFRRASSVGFRRRLPASYEAAWSLPRPDFHRL